MKPLMIAHRGDTINCVENTIESFQSAFDLGADGVELDVQLDANGNVIVVHDYLHDKSKKYPELSEVLQLFGQKGRLEIEIKTINKELVQKVGDLIRKYKPRDFEITTSVYPLFEYIKKEFPNSKVGIINMHKLLEKWMPESFIHEFILSYLKITGASVLHLELEYLTAGLVNFIHDNKYIVHTHMYKDGDLAVFRKIVNLKVDQITFDNINLLTQLKEA